MFVGHYGPSFAAKAASAAAPLWLFVVAAQFLDYLWAAFVLAGVEHVRIVEGYTAMSALDLFDMPWTHSLVMAAVWSAVFAAIARFLGVRSLSACAFLAATVLSHWILDLAVHVPDLPLWPGDGAPKVGFGAWRDPALTLVLESAALFGGFALYMRATRPKRGFGAVSPYIPLALMIAAYAYNHYAPPPSSGAAAAASALAAYTVFAALAWLCCDRVRVAR